MPTQPKNSLPIITETSPFVRSASRRNASLGHRLAVRAFRFVIVLMGIWLLGSAAQSAKRENDLGPVISLSEARTIFGETTRLGPRDEQRNGHVALAADGIAIGFVLRTSPEMDHLVGYSGPSDSLIGLGVDGTIRKVALVSSGDTAAHVEMVRGHEAFWNSFRGWNPASEPLPEIDGVSGSTLTSFAMIEAVQQRLSGKAISLRFPDEVTPDEVKHFFPECLTIENDSPRSGWTAAKDSAEKVLGFVLRTSPAADNVAGYRGPTEALVAVETDQKTIRQVVLRSSYDTAEYVERVRDSKEFLSRLASHSMDEWRDIDFKAAGIEGVSGATQTSFGLAEGIRRRLLADAEIRQQPVAAKESWLRPRDWGMLAIILGGLVVGFSRLRGNRFVRRIWQLVLVVGLGWFLGDLLSLSLLVGWARNGVSFFATPMLVVLAAVALVVPWGTRRQIYCHQICPHGAVQEWTGRWRRLHVRLPRKLNRALHWLPGLLLVSGFLLAILFVGLDLSSWEPFDAWSLRGAAVASAIIAVVGLAASFFVPQAYCRFGCPTGSLLNFVRSHGNNDRFGVRELVAGATIAVAGLLIGGQFGPGALLPRPGSAAETSNTARKMSGEAFGTSWSVEFREPVSDAARIRDLLATELERIEALLSRTRTTSAVSAFNSSRTTLEMEYEPEFVLLVARLQEFFEHRGEPYEPTVLPNHKLWRNGPTGDDEIAEWLGQTGIEDLTVSTEFNSLRKRDPGMTLDLEPILAGYAVDQLANILRERTNLEFLVRVGMFRQTEGQWQALSGE